MNKKLAVVKEKMIKEIDNNMEIQGVKQYKIINVPVAIVLDDNEKISNVHSTDVARYLFEEFNK